MKYLEFYKDCLKENSSPFLCNAFMFEDLFSLFKPTCEELDQHVIDGYKYISWGSKQNEDASRKFTPLRQNIVLFLAAMHGEL